MTSLLQFARHRIDDSVRDLLDKEISSASRRPGWTPTLDDAILAGIGAYALSRHLPGDVLQSIQVFTAAARHALVLSNLPAEDCPATPVSGFRNEPELAVTNPSTWGAVRLFDRLHALRRRLRERRPPDPQRRPQPGGLRHHQLPGGRLRVLLALRQPPPAVRPAGLRPAPPYTPPYLTFAVRNEEQVPTEIAALDDVMVRLDAGDPADPPGRPSSRSARPTPPTAGHRPAARGRDHRARRHRPAPRPATTAAPPAAAPDRARAALERWSGDPYHDPGRRTRPGHRRLHDLRQPPGAAPPQGLHPAPDATARWLRRCYAA
ncbi:clavaminate synthase [Streptomyces tricolor]|nr:clavaminate synthase [Streptomyces tricolor]